MVVDEKKKILKKKLYFKIYIFIYTQTQTTFWNTNFLQENVLIPYYSADQSLIITDLQHFEKKKKERNLVHRKVCDRHPLHPFLLIKALNLCFLMFPLKKKENNSLLGMTTFNTTIKRFYTECERQQQPVYKFQMSLSLWNKDC